MSRDPDQLSDDLPERLIDTVTMSQANCDFNTRYGIARCRICEGGVPLQQLHSHAKTNQIIKMRPSRDDDKVVERTLLHSANLTANKDTFYHQIVSELKQKLGQNVYIRPSAKPAQWYADAVPHPKQITPILGLRTLIGVVCTLCPDRRTAICAANSGSIAKHRRELHGRGLRAKDSEEPVSMQTLSFGGYYVRFFPTPGGPQAGAGDSYISEEGAESDCADDIAMFIRKEKSNLLGSDSEEDAEDRDVIDPRTLPPFYRDERVHEFLKDANPHKTLSLLQLPSIGQLKSSSAPRYLSRLYHIVVETFLKDCDLAAGMIPVIRQLLMQSSP